MFEASADDLTRREKARIIKTAVTPRPIAWVSSIDTEGNENLAPYSSYNYANLTRPVVMFNSTLGPSGERKDTVNNAIETEEFAVNIVTSDLLNVMDTTSANLDPAESEFSYADIESAPCAVIDAPRVAEAAVTLECALYDTMEIYDSIMVLGEVNHVQIDPDVMSDGKIDSRKLDTVGRLGGPYYTVSEPVEFERQF